MGEIVDLAARRPPVIYSIVVTDAQGEVSVAIDVEHDDPASRLAAAEAMHLAADALILDTMSPANDG